MNSLWTFKMKSSGKNVSATFIKSNVLNCCTVE